MKSERRKKPRPPLDAEGLERLALFYAGRYATTRAKLGAYLKRKIAERGWDGGSGDPIAPLVERFTELGYVNDRAFAEAKAGSLQRRGYGERRVAQALNAAGIGEEDGQDARDGAREGAWDAIIRFARRKRIGPYAAELPDRLGREKAIAAMLRAGHPMDLARRVVDMRPGDAVDC